MAGRPMGTGDHRGRVIGLVHLRLGFGPMRRHPHRRSRLLFQPQRIRHLRPVRRSLDRRRHPIHPALRLARSAGLGGAHPRRQGTHRRRWRRGRYQTVADSCLGIHGRRSRLGLEVPDHSGEPVVSDRDGPDQLRRRGRIMARNSSSGCTNRNLARHHRIY